MWFHNHQKQEVKQCSLKFSKSLDWMISERWPHALNCHIQSFLLGLQMIRVIFLIFSIWLFHRSLTTLQLWVKKLQNDKLPVTILWFLCFDCDVRSFYFCAPEIAALCLLLRPTFSPSSSDTLQRRERFAGLLTKFFQTIHFFDTICCLNAFRTSCGGLKMAANTLWFFSCQEMESISSLNLGWPCYFSRPVTCGRNRMG